MHILPYDEEPRQVVVSKIVFTGNDLDTLEKIKHEHREWTWEQIVDHFHKNQYAEPKPLYDTKKTSKLREHFLWMFEELKYSELTGRGHHFETLEDWLGKEFVKEHLS